MQHACAVTLFVCVAVPASDMQSKCWIQLRLGKTKAGCIIAPTRSFCQSQSPRAHPASTKPNSKQQPTQNGNQDVDRHPISNHLAELSVTDVRRCCILNELLR